MAINKEMLAMLLGQKKKKKGLFATPSSAALAYKDATDMDKLYKTDPRLLYGRGLMKSAAGRTPKNVGEGISKAADAIFGALAMREGLEDVREKERIAKENLFKEMQQTKADIEYGDLISRTGRKKWTDPDTGEISRELPKGRLGTIGALGERDLSPTGLNYLMGLRKEQRKTEDEDRKRALDFENAITKIKYQDVLRNKNEQEKRRIAEKNRVLDFENKLILKGIEKDNKNEMFFRKVEIESNKDKKRKLEKIAEMQSDVKLLPNKVQDLLAIQGSKPDDKGNYNQEDKNKVLNLLKEQEQEEILNNQLTPKIKTELLAMGKKGKPAKATPENVAIAIERVFDRSTKLAFVKGVAADVYRTKTSVQATVNVIRLLRKLSKNMFPKTQGDFKGLLTRLGSGAALKYKRLIEKNNDWVTYDRITKATLSKMVRALGEKGVLTQQDVERVLSAYPKTGWLLDSQDQANSLFDSLEYLLSQGLQNTAGITIDKSGRVNLEGMFTNLFKKTDTENPSDNYLKERFGKKKN